MWTVVPRYTMQIQFRIIRLQYSTERICAAIGDISTTPCVLYCKHGAKYSAHPTVNAIWTVVPTIYNEITDPYVWASIFSWKYLRCYWRYLDNSIRVILQTWSQIQCTSSRLRFVTCSPGHIQWNDDTAYWVCNIQLNVSKLLLKICHQFKERCTAILVPNTAHVLWFMLCLLWSRAYTMQLQLRIFRLQHSTESTCAASGDMPTFGCALYCKFGGIYSAHPPVYAMSTVVPDIYNVITVTYIQASIFKWTNLRCNWGYPDISMRVML
jgi:hypothetical protein